ncbi:hypothetical protein CHUAL_010128 [Chamberlinius hualienensis]
MSNRDMQGPGNLRSSASPAEQWTSSVPPVIQPTSTGSVSVSQNGTIQPESSMPNQFPPSFPSPEFSVDDNASHAGRFSNITYTPVLPHWMYCKQVEKKPVWVPFSLLDSLHLEEEFSAKNGTADLANVVVPTDGGRYDVYLKTQERHSVYWEESITPVRRATWFYRPYGARLFVPYPETFADKLEEEYSVAVSTNTWHRRLEFPEGDTVVIHSPSVILHYQALSPHEWEGTPEDQVKPTVVKRGMEDFENIEDGEGLQIDHLVFIVHGIGAFCDLKFRTLPEVVNDIRHIAADLSKTHFRQHIDEGRVSRLEFVPVSWHTFLHGEATGIDEKLNPITLTSIPKLRYFANDAILDVLFYTSPVYCQAIIDQVCSEINRLYALFTSRNPTFSGKVSLAGHSLGSLILFDLLCYQNTTPQHPFGKTILQQFAEQHAQDNLSDFDSSGIAAVETDLPILTVNEALKNLNLESFFELFEKEKLDMDSIAMCTDSDLKDLGLPLGPRKKILTYIQEHKANLDSEKSDKFTDMPKIDSQLPRMGRRQSETTVNYVLGVAGTGHPYIKYPSLDFNPTCFFALGSPIAMFLTVRGLEMSMEDFKLPTCPAFYNVFHPYDPVAYRIEPLINPKNLNIKPVMIPHHKGRKRMHLEIKESLSRVGADLKQKLMESLKSTWNTINDFAKSHGAYSAGVQVGDTETDDEHHHDIEEADDDTQSIASNQEGLEDEGYMGQLNSGRRIDYVLQEKPIESFNEYLFALGSHTCYWESEDTVLLMLKEIYGSYGIHPNPNPHEFPTAPKIPQLYNPHEAQRYYASNPIPPPFTSPEPSANPYRLSNVGKQQPPLSSAAPPLHPSLYTIENRQNVVNNVVQISNTSSVGNSILPVNNQPPGIGMDPTAPPITGSFGPPPLQGFVKQSVIRK